MIQTLDIRTARPAPAQAETPPGVPDPRVDPVGAASADSKLGETGDIGPYRVILCCGSRGET
jgi:hypothetical protein